MLAATGVEIDTASYRGRCRRDFFRVSSWLPVRLAGLSEEAAANLSRELNAPGQESSSLADDRLEARLCQIESKLDLLLEHAGLDVEPPLARAAKQEIEISGSGIRLQTTQLHRAGDLVKVELLLPEERGRAICLLGRIVSGNAGDRESTRPGVALVFQSIRDRDRDAIVRHAYEVQRLSLARTSKRDDLR